jgi:hypothetical protein
MKKRIYELQKRFGAPGAFLVALGCVLFPGFTTSFDGDMVIGFVA